METFTWKDEFCIGIDEIDKQHQYLVQLINQIAIAINQKAEIAFIQSIYEQLVEYTQYHFNEEEKYFIRLTRADKLLHQLQHSHFIEELKSYRHQGLENIDMNNILFFLTDWLLNHILGEDRKIVVKKQQPLSTKVY
ncbi:hemerythrin family protein [Thalassotalea sp. M1531]|uniref:Hemerythrin family protein n=1 Tax=Thalassotalea algicola TaxID=2716224 RepID=A0A7Y0Q7M5_9GAMM|nr:bacteriohemerythrin [Thalassotalea algicola]NMP32361.1 hemerythrin family protein [Thalassotalea algicola]